MRWQHVLTVPWHINDRPGTLHLSEVLTKASRQAAITHCLALPQDQVEEHTKRDSNSLTEAEAQIEHLSSQLIEMQQQLLAATEAKAESIKQQLLLRAEVQKQVSQVCWLQQEHNKAAEVMQELIDKLKQQLVVSERHQEEVKEERHSLLQTLDVAQVRLTAATLMHQYMPTWELSKFTMPHLFLGSVTPAYFKRQACQQG